jgi:hypothetical protein
MQRLRDLSCSVLHSNGEVLLGLGGVESLLGGRQLSEQPA